MVSSITETENSKKEPAKPAWNTKINEVRREEWKIFAKKHARNSLRTALNACMQ